MNAKNNSGPVWISAGEASGDMHGALLVKALKRQNASLELVGMGGPAMEDAGVGIQYPMQLISLVGLTEVLGGLPRILKLLRALRKDFERIRPRAIILLDCPDFHFRVVRIARKLGIPVYYYISPQIWAWRSGRANFLRDNVRKVLCILPFEKEFYARFGMDVDYVGNPLVDQVPTAELDTRAVDEKHIGILPGSRGKEVATLLPEFAETARRLLERDKDLHFTIIRAPGMGKERLMDIWPVDVPVAFAEPEDRYTVIRSCKFVLAASGTVSLECALIGTPALIAYKLSSLSYRIARWVVKVDFASLPNLILGKEVFPEHLQDMASADALTRSAHIWLENLEIFNRVKEELERLRTMLGEPGAPDRAAKIILDDLETLHP
ncbi:lipid-A-disaccharide synthase [Salidesulfovibrio onnuriiensis]|uniref:lipid-A-disaccharide synthase n=1 Tax=Salidesulfovibrio onnuriiensis TaxID=2583823 RepID=UPI0011C73015|nr:lipid-A-disaccharide synthase [Salidesulfovibrio onnuriiensis]